MEEYYDKYFYFRNIKDWKKFYNKKIVEEFPYYKVIPLDIIINAYKKNI